MAPLDDLDVLEAELDPAARYVVRLLRVSLEATQRSLDEVKAALATRDAQNARLTEQIAEFQRMLFGSRSEKLPPIESEVRRIVEAEELTVDGDPMPDDPSAKVRERRRKGRKKSEPTRKKKRALRNDLPVVHERVDVAPGALPEGYTLGDFREVGEGETIRRVEHVREHLVVIEYHLQTLASKDGEHIVRAEAPAGVADGGHYGPGVYAHVVTAKCADSLPLYRIEKIMERAGCPIARSTLCSFFHRSAELLSPLYERLFEIAKADPYLHADETTLKVQHKDQCLRGWIWALLSKQAIVYTFDESRGGSVARRLLGVTNGFLIIDGYSGYNGVIQNATEDRARARIHVACWSHLRRYFFKALSTAPEARQVMDLIAKLYRVEHVAAERGLLGSAEHLALRRAESLTLVDEIERWVQGEEGKHAPKSPIGRAITYATNQRKALRRFLDDPKLPLDNNFAERGLRIFALGRKNFLFAGHVEGAQNLAVLQSIVSTCRLHGVNPYEYVRDMLIRMQHHVAADIDELLPWNWVPPDENPAAPP